MLEGDEWKHEPEKDNPEKWSAEQALKVEKAVEDLLNSLTPADAHVPLFSFAEQVTWNLNRKTRR